MSLAEPQLNSRQSLAEPQLNSLLRVSHNIAAVEATQFDGSKINDKLKQQLTQKACVKVNAENAVYSDLISLEVTGDELSSRAAEETMMRLKVSDVISHKSQEKLSRVPDIMDYFTPDLHRESPSLSIVAMPTRTLKPATAESDDAFSIYRHFRSWQHYD